MMRKNNSGGITFSDIIILFILLGGVSYFVLNHGIELLEKRANAYVTVQETTFDAQNLTIKINNNSNVALKDILLQCETVMKSGTEIRGFATLYQEVAASKTATLTTQKLTSNNSRYEAISFSEIKSVSCKAVGFKEVE